MPSCPDAKEEGERDCVYACVRVSESLPKAEAESLRALCIPGGSMPHTVKDN